MPHIRSVTLSTTKNVFPFSLPIFKHLEIKFDQPVTIFVGENGSGKSTLLEAMGLKIGLPAIGGAELDYDASLQHLSLFSDALTISWSKQTRRGFFQRAEDVFGFTKKIEDLKNELGGMVDDVDQTMSSYGQQLTRGIFLGQKGALIEKYGENLDANSHGETFLKLFQTRFIPNALYLLDEPEAPLSFKRQLSLLYLIDDMVKQGCQFIIATHSPVLAAFPGATIYSFDSTRIQPVAYDDIEAFSLMRDFLNNRQAFLRINQ